MSISFDPNGGDIAVNVQVGQLLGSFLQASVYSATGAFLQDLTNQPIDIDNNPTTAEYIIPAPLLANGALILKHTYSTYGHGTADFLAVSTFKQKNKPPQSESCAADGIVVGSTITHRIDLEQAQ